MLRSGDVYSIKTSLGTAYFQYVKKVHPMGTLIRVFEGVYATPPDLYRLVKTETNFWIFFPVSIAAKIGAIEKIQNLPVPERFQRTPIFRAGVPDSEGRINTWWLWNGQEEWMVGEITDEQRKLPLREIWNIDFLITRIEQGWRPENDSS